MKALAILLFLLPAAAQADVADSAASGFTLKFSWTIKAAPADLYRQVTAVGQWWESAHTYSGDARNLSIDVKPGGCFCEKLPNGGVQHMTVVRYEAGKTLVMNGGLGPLQSAGAAAAMTFAIAAAEGGSKLDVTYAVTGYLPGGMAALAPIVDAVLKTQLTRLKALAETGKAEAKP